MQTNIKEKDFFFSEWQDWDKVPKHGLATCPPHEVSSLPSRLHYEEAFPCWDPSPEGCVCVGVCVRARVHAHWPLPSVKSSHTWPLAMVMDVRYCGVSHRGIDFADELLPRNGAEAGICGCLLTSSPSPCLPSSVPCSLVTYPSPLTS